MSDYKRCPSCGNEADGGIFGGPYIPLHKCKDKDHMFCNKCKNGDRCPMCGSANVYWDYDKAFTNK